MFSLHPLILTIQGYVARISWVFGGPWHTWFHSSRKVYLRNVCLWDKSWNLTQWYKSLHERTSYLMSEHTNPETLTSSMLNLCMVSLLSLALQMQCSSFFLLLWVSFQNSCLSIYKHWFTYDEKVTPVLSGRVRNQNLGILAHLIDLSLIIEEVLEL